ncbi:MAG: AAA family ATPase, partial [Clostridiales bacterium]|nr:AAA family ATPase [Clostridiales bacterium]
MKWIPLPVGVDSFEKMIRNHYYYIDKTLYIKELLDRKGEVNLFTRPRRFGKTLNMSMLRYFFEKGDYDNAELFQGLKIMDAGEEYLSHMGQYPVISISLKSMKQYSYELSYDMLRNIVREEYKRHWELVRDSGKLVGEDLTRFERILNLKGAESDYADALRFLSECLYTCTGRRSIILIDEYDVPLESAYFGGFYDRMVSLIRSLFESALKTNDFLEFAVVTGCLRISKESIFTGLNNLNIISIMDDSYAEHFGFTQEEVDSMLSFYHLESKRDCVKEWYDGYQFGDTEVYNPWS